MNKAVYIVRNDDMYIHFNDCSQAFRYARARGLKEVFKKVPDQIDWYYWDWDNKRWVYP